MRIMFVGDINLGEYYPSFGHGPGSFAKNNNIFANVKSIFEQADFVVGNLEAAITSIGLNTEDPESAVLRGHPDHAHQLKDAGFKVLQIANNHTVQHGNEGFENTLEILQRLDIKFTGKRNENLTTIEMDGVSVGFIAASDVPDNTDKQQVQYNRLDEDFIASIDECVKQVDHLMVLLHWGLEACTTPMAYQRELAQTLRDKGVRAIIGTHPHLFYEIEKQPNFTCAYSLGNFVFDLCWDKRMNKSGILDITIGETDLDVRMWPIELKRNGCLPTPSGTEVSITDKYIAYDLGLEMDKQLLRKNIYFAKNLFKGNTSLKLKFFTNKIKRVIGRIFVRGRVEP